jgi:ATP adenylyltransferase
MILPEFLARPLPGRLAEAARRALACGALQPIETEQIRIEDGGVSFLVRKVSSLARKERARRPGASAPEDPFLPGEPELCVADISPTHRALLNKFNVIERHLLVVTRRFVDQECLLDRDDFAALAACMAGIDGLGFYNGGRVAGASQPHKHLQLVPLPIAGAGPPVPIDVLFEAGPDAPAIAAFDALPFAHAWTRLDPALFGAPDEAGEALCRRYRALMDRTGVTASEVSGEQRQGAPYNLLLTRRWMLLVPRTREHCEDISINALGYAGSLFVNDDRQLQQIRRIGPMQILRHVARPSGA